MKQNATFHLLLNEIKALQKIVLVDPKRHVVPNWLSKKLVQEFFDYGDTQIAALLKSKDLVVSRIGSRVFIKTDSLAKLLEKNIQN